jgi:hypothetical protein
VEFLSDRLGFAEWSANANDDRRYLMYTVDGGTRWQKVAVPHYVEGCGTFQGDLLCTGPDLTVLTIHPK